MLALIAAALILTAGAVDAPDVWLVARGGKLTRAARDGTPLQVFDIVPTHGALVFRGRQIAFSDSASVTWIDGAGAIMHAPAIGGPVLGWRDTAPLVWDGKTLATLGVVKSALNVRTGDTPVFAAFFGSAGIIVSQTTGGTLRVAAVGSQKFGVDFGKWRLVDARITSATTGYLLLMGSGSALVRVSKGRADIVAMDADGKLGMGLASDGRAYIERHAVSDGESRAPVTDIEEVIPTRVPKPLGRIAGTCEIVDVDRKASVAYVVRQSDKGPFYERVNYVTGKFSVLQSNIDFVVPAFGGVGVLAAPAPPGVFDRRAIEIGPRAGVGMTPNPITS